MKAIRLVALVFAFLAVWVEGYARMWWPQEISSPIFSGNYVADPLYIFSDDERDALDSMCLRIDKSLARTVVVVLDSYDGDATEFCRTLYSYWEVARFGRGMLVVIEAEAVRCHFFNGESRGVPSRKSLNVIASKVLLPSLREKKTFEGVHALLADILDEADYVPEVSSPEPVASSDPDVSAPVPVEALDPVDDYASDSYGYDDTDDYSYSDDDYDDDYDDPDDLAPVEGMAFIWFFVLMLGATQIKSYNIKRSLADIRASRGSKVLNANESSIVVRAVDGCRSDDWSVWGNHGFLRFVLLDVSFFMACFMSSVLDSYFWSLTLFFTYASLLWCLRALRLARQGGNSCDFYLRLLRVCNSGSLMVMMVFVPHVGLLFNFLFRQKLKQLKDIMLMCSVCQSRNLVPAPDAQSVKLGASDFNMLRVGVLQSEVYVCHQSHLVAFLYEGQKYDQYAVCPLCGSRATHSVKVGSAQREMTVCVACGKQWPYGAKPTAENVISSTIE